MNFYKAGAQMEKDFLKFVKKERKDITYIDTLRDTSHEEEKAAMEKLILQEKRKMRFGLLLQEAFFDVREEMITEGLIKNRSNDKLKGHYFITIRPDEKSVSFVDFFEDVQKFVRRKCFIEYKLTFEQKGTTPETYGQGFHAHIIAECKQRSKTEVLRDTQSTFKNYTSANCIEVVILKTKKDLEGVTNYITLYTSDDDHKEVTQAADAAWREKLSLSPLYTGSLGDSSALPSIKSVVGQGEITNGCYIVQMD